MMEAKDIEKAIQKTERLLKRVSPDRRALAFPIVLDRVLVAEPERVFVGQPRVRTAARTVGREASKKKLTRPDLVRTMVRAGWFKKKRRLGEIAKELRRRGMQTPLTSLPALLLPLVLEGVLERDHDAKGVYVYFSK